MRSVDEIRAEFEKTILKPLKEQETSLDKKSLYAFEKLKNIFRIIAWAIFLFPLPIILLHRLSVVGSGQNEPMIGFFLVGIILILSVESMNLKESRMAPQQFKETVVKKVVKLFDPNWLYYPKRYISTQALKSSQLFPGSDYNGFRGDDLIQGRVGAAHFAFSELELGMTWQGAYEEYMDSIFSGCFMVAEFNKSLNHQTFVLPKTWYRILKKHLEPVVGLENPEFDKNFNAFSDDQVESRYILTPTIMENIVRLYNKFQFPLAFSFHSNHMFMAIPISSIFEPTKVYTTGDYSDIRKVYSIIEFIYMTIQEMELNKRIWTV